MTCTTISDANPDIAGTGVCVLRRVLSEKKAEAIQIILAFGLQALISILLSITAKLLDDPWDFVGGKGDPNRQLLQSVKNSLHRAIDEFNFSLPMSQSIKNASYTMNKEFKESVNALAKGSQGTRTNLSEPQNIETADAAHTISSVIRQQVLFAFEEAKQSILPLAVNYDDIKNALNNNDLRRETFGEAGPDYAKERYMKKQELMCELLLTISDAQTMTGIALTITAIAQSRSLSLYHLHIVYDTVSFTAVSNFAAISYAYDKYLSGQGVRYASIIVFLILYFVFVIQFGIRLNDWNESNPGDCYSTSRIALPNAKHPYVDRIYLAVTTLYCFVIMGLATINSHFPPTRARSQSKVILIGSLQFVLHSYMVIALRVSNQALLNDTSLEEQWGFGQVLAVVMLGATVTACAKGLEEYYSWRKKQSKLNGSTPEANRASGVPQDA